MLRFESIGYILLMDYDSEHKVDDLDDGGCLILKEAGRRRVKLCQTVTATLQC